MLDTVKNVWYTDTVNSKSPFADSPVVGTARTCARFLTDTVVCRNTARVSVIYGKFVSVAAKITYLCAGL